MKMGWDVAIRPDVFRSVDAALLGHIHRQQQVAPNAWYAGSPEYLDFGEATQTKGFLLWDVQPGRLPVVTPMPSGARPMRVVHVGTTGGGGLAIMEPGPRIDIDGAIVRLDADCATRPAPADLALIVRWAREAGASHVEVHVTVAEQAKAKISLDAEGDLVETLARWLSAKGYPEEPALSAGITLAASLGD
jgi:DNA repair exonuclease SbcCD nuclease subunit